MNEYTNNNLEETALINRENKDKNRNDRYLEESEHGDENQN